MVINAQINAQLIRQTEQPNQYWLIYLNLDKEIELPVNFFVEVEGIELKLFSQDSSNKQAQFLAKQSLNQTTSFTINLKRNSDWRFLDEFEKKLDSKKTHCILVPEQNIAQGFYLSKKFGRNYSLALIMEAKSEFPFQIKPAKFMFKNLPIKAAGMIGACSLLEDWKIPNRLCSQTGIPGCFDGDLDAFENIWQPPVDWLIINL